MSIHSFLHLLLFVTPWCLIQAQDTLRLNYYFDRDSTKVSEIFTIALPDSTLHGTYSAFFTNGRLKTTGKYSHGKSSGQWIYFYENGNKQASGELTKGINTGCWNYYFENGAKKSRGCFDNGGNKTGLWTYYYENEGIKASGDFSQNQKNGLWYYFDEEGTLYAQASMILDSGYYKELYKSGELKAEGKILNNQSQGHWIYYFENGTKEMEGTFLDGKKEGEWIFYTPQGHLFAKGGYSLGKKTGTWNYFSEDGTPKGNGEYSNDKKIGKWYFFYENGAIDSQETASGDTLYVERFHQNGAVLCQGKEILGKREGVWRYFDEQGLFTGETMYTSDTGRYIGYYRDTTVHMKGKMYRDKKIGKWELYDPLGNLSGEYYPLYEQENPIVKLPNKDTKIQPKQTSVKTDYLFKYNSNRYFDERINELKGWIIATNPIFTTVGYLPIGLEYYLQERLGHELLLEIHRKPFFAPVEKIDLLQLYTRGWSMELRQKYYAKDERIGMLYFGHSLGFSSLSYQTNVQNTNISLESGGNIAELQSLQLKYSLMFGSRWMQDAGSPGFTVDLFFQPGVGIRSYQSNFQSNPELEVIFNSVDQQPLDISLRFGLMIGWCFKKSTSK